MFDVYVLLWNFSKNLSICCVMLLVWFSILVLPVFDFGDSSPEVYGNINAPKAVVLSALIYSLRCLVGQDIPLNQVKYPL